MKIFVHRFIWLYKLVYLILFLFDLYILLQMKEAENSKPVSQVPSPPHLDPVHSHLETAADRGVAQVSINVLLPFK